MNKINQIEKQGFSEKSVKPNIPERKFRAGSVTATIWKNVVEKENTPVEYRTISFERHYKDKNGEWQSSNTLRINDLPKAMLVIDKAYEYLVLKEPETGFGEDI
ncbi:hypothetical protein JXB41_08200 [Candidatus Woesearchaeota archaeon]|nr:hypothetical protein [Candidatus Woesearchaeota archaeon]